MYINGVNGAEAPQPVFQDIKPVKPKKKGTIPVGGESNQVISMSAGMRIESTDEQGNRVVIQYDDKGLTYTEKSYSGKGGQLYTSKTYDQNQKLKKEAFYDFQSGKLYLESEYKDNGRIDRHYNDDGSYTGKSIIVNNKDGSVEQENYDADGKLQGYEVQKKTGKTDRLGRSIYEIKSFDAEGNLLGTCESSFPSVGGMALRN